MNEEQMRKEFEDLVVVMKDSQGMSYYLYPENGVYVFKNTHDLWVGFKLSREAIQQAGYKVEE